MRAQTRTPELRPCAAWIVQIKEQGLLAWARDTNRKRLGSSVTPGEFDWWVNSIHGKTPLSTILGYLRMVPVMEVRGDLDRVICPTLIITTAGPGRRSPESYGEWQPRIKNSELLIIEGDAFHPSGVYPDRCALATVPFVEQH